MRLGRVREATAAAAACAVVGIFVSSGAGAPDAAEAQGVDDRPNVVVIQADDQSREMMRVMTETNRLIAERGATFRNHFTNWPLCCPSRSTQLTGQYAHNHNVLGNSPPEGGYGVFPRDDNLAVWLNDAGYRVGHVGKFLNGYGPRTDRESTPYNDVTEVPPGWTDWRTGSAGTTYTFYDFSQNVWTDAEDGDRDGDLVTYGSDVNDYKGDVNTEEALDLISDYSAQASPFYLQVDYLAPHGGGPSPESPQAPFDCDGTAKPAPRHANAFDAEPLAALADDSYNEADVSDKPTFVQRLGEISPGDEANILRRYRCRLESTLAIDEGVKQIVDRLEDTGELENTYVIYTADNGFFHGEHRIQGGKNRAYEPAVRVPLLIRGPLFPEDVNVRELTTNADPASTVMAVTGAVPSADRPPDGRSLTSAAHKPWRETGRELLIETNSFTAVRTQRYKLIENDDGFTELYDFDSDPFELSNVAADPAYAEPLARLRARLAALRTCKGETCRLSPALQPRFETDRGASGCTKRRITVGLAGADLGEVATLAVNLDNAPAATDAQAPHEVLLRNSTFKQRNADVEVLATLIDGRRMSWRKSFELCG